MPISNSIWDKLFPPSQLKYSSTPDFMFNKKQLSIGTKVEMEHTRMKNTAKAIAKAHLKENPYYYTYLKRMEKQMKNKSDYRINEKKRLKLLKKYKYDEQKRR